MVTISKRPARSRLAFLRWGRQQTGPTCQRLTRACIGTIRGGLILSGASDAIDGDSLGAGIRGGVWCARAGGVGSYPLFVVTPLVVGCEVEVGLGIQDARRLKSCCIIRGYVISLSKYPLRHGGNEYRTQPTIRGEVRYTYCLSFPTLHVGK